MSEWIIKQSYIEPTILFKYSIWKKWLLGAGFSYGYLIKTTFSEEYGAIPPEYKNLSFTKFDKCWLFELSYAISENFELNFRFNHSLVSTTNQTKKLAWYLYGFPQLDQAKGTFNQVAGLNLKYTINKKDQ